MILAQHIHQTGIMPCCRWNGERFRGQIDDYDDSDYLTTIQTAMTNHDMNMLNNTCQECIELEEFGLPSLRQHYAKNRNFEDGFTDLDIRPDNLCNLKCRMCGPEYSNLIYEEQKLHDPGSESGEQQDLGDLTKIDFSNIRHLKVMGGEPTVSPKVWNLLRYLNDNDMSKNIELEYVSNITSFHLTWRKIIKPYKRRYLTMSLDATGKYVEYIRTGLKWKSAEENAHKIITSGEFDELAFNIVAQVVNFAVVDEWIDWFLQFDNVNIEINPVQGRHGLISALPPHIIEYQIKQLQKKSSHPVIDQAINLLQQIRHDHVQLERWKMRTKYLDRIRKTNVRDLGPVFDEIMDYPTS